MDAEEIRQYVSRTFGGVEVMVASEEAGAPQIAWGDTFFMYDPDRNLEPARKLPFATIVTNDYPDFGRGLQPRSGGHIQAQYRCWPRDLSSQVFKVARA